MTEEQKAAYVNSQSVCALIEAMGMQAENRHHDLNNDSILYGEEAFNTLASRYGIDNNSVIGLFHSV